MSGDIIGPCCFPVILSPKPDNSQHQAIEYNLFEELNQSVVNNRIQRHFTLKILDAVLRAMHMVPQDVSYLAYSYLSLSQYLHFHGQLQELDTEQAARNREIESALLKKCC